MKIYKIIQIGTKLNNSRCLHATKNEIDQKQQSKLF